MVRPVRGWLRLAPDSLVAHARRASLAFVTLTLLVTLTEIAGVTAVPVERRMVAASAVVVWATWALWRHRSPRAWLILDLVPLAALGTVAVALGGTGLIFAPVLVTIYQRTLLATRAEAIATGLLLFGVVATASLQLHGPAWLISLEAPALLLAFPTIGLVLQALGAAAVAQERSARWERLLTEASAELLQASGIPETHRIGVTGTRRLVRRDDVTVGLWWLEADTLTLTAAAGAGGFALDRVRVDQLPADHRIPFTTGRPAAWGPDEVSDAERSLGHPHRFACVIVVPLVQGTTVVGALVVAAPTPLPTELLDVLERFAHELSLADTRARLLAELERKNAELSRSHELKDQFLSMVSHELRTPLTSICGFTATLLSRWAALSDEQRQDYLRIVARQGQHQQRLVEDLLITTRIMAGGLRVRPERVDVTSVVTSAAGELGFARGELDLLAGAPAHAWVDPFHLHQIVTNLLSNARKYGAPPYQVTAAVVGERLELEVADQGPGIPEDFRAHLFDPFRQAATGDRRTDSGVGLGLAIVRELVLANQGRVVHDDTTPTGARFVVSLPVARPAVVATVEG